MFCTWTQLCWEYKRCGVVISNDIKSTCTMCSGKQMMESRVERIGVEMSSCSSLTNCVTFWDMIRA